jgi:hypothetical protein
MNINFGDIEPIFNFALLNRLRGVNQSFEIEKVEAEDFVGFRILNLYYAFLIFLQPDSV